MAKIVEIDLENDVILIGMPNGSVEEALLSEIDFIPHVGDEVEIFKTATKTIINKVEKHPENPNAQGININLNQNQVNNGNPSTVYVSGKVVNKITYVVLAILLGGIGIHKFYAGKTGAGIMCLIFFWTGIPAFIAFIEGIMAAFRPADERGNIIV